MHPAVTMYGLMLYYYYLKSLEYIFFFLLLFLILISFFLGELISIFIVNLLKLKYFFAFLFIISIYCIIYVVLYASLYFVISFIEKKKDNIRKTKKTNSNDHVCVYFFIQHFYFFSI